MKITSSIHPYPYYNESMVTNGWNTIEKTIENNQDARELFCEYHYSSHIWKNGIRNQENCVASTALIVDYDNGLSIAEAKQKFKDYKYVLISSRNHQKIKKNKEHLGAVDRFHIYFPLETAMSNSLHYSAYQNIDLFDEADPTAFETSRFFYKSPQDAFIEVNDSGRYLDEALPPHKIPVKMSTNPAVSKRFTQDDLNKILSRCQAVRDAFSDIGSDSAENSTGHHKRLLAANMISNTIDDEQYVLDLFKNVSDFDPQKTLKQYRSVRKLKPITCKKLQSSGWDRLCKETCPLMNDLQRKSPVAFAYRDSEGLKLNTELLNSIEKNENLEELLRRLRFYGDTPKRESLITLISRMKGLSLSKITKMMENMEYKTDDSIEFEQLCENWYRIGSKFSEVVVLPEKGDIRITTRGALDVESKLGKQAKKYIIEKKSLPEPVDFDFIGGSGQAIGYESAESGFVAYAPLPPIIKTDNHFINEKLNEWFGKYDEFIKSYIAYYTYTNYIHLPMPILTGPRGTGKSKFVDLMVMIYPKLSGRFATKTQFSEHNGLKLAFIEEADEFDNQNLYSIMKDVGGSDLLEKNIKYGPKTIVRNNLNLIVISNNKIPIYLKSKEMPTSEKNNQFFVWEFPQLKKNIDGQIKKKFEERIGYWLRTEIKDLFDRLENRPDKHEFRYQIRVPITKHERLLFENNRTEIENILDEFLEGLKTPFILSTDLKRLEEKHGIKVNSYKRKLVDMNVIESTRSISTNRKLDSSIDGFPIDRSRIFKLTKDYLAYFWEKKQKH